MILIGYARVSTIGQSLDQQRAALTEAGCSRIYAEQVSGAYRKRPELDRMLDALRAGDLVVVTRLDRLARSTRDLLSIAEQLGEVGAGLRSLREPWADTTSPSGKLVLTIFAGIADFERELIRERTSEGRAAALARGVAFGAPRRLTPQQLDHAKKMLAAGERVADAAKILGVHRSTLYRALKD